MDVLKTRWTLDRDRPYCVADVGSYFGLEITLDTPSEATGGPSYPESMQDRETCLQVAQHIIDLHNSSLADEDRAMLESAVEKLTGPLPDIWSLWELTTLPGGQVDAHYETNDDDDDGVPGEVVYANYTLRNRAKALELSGKTRTGVFGHQVTVRLDGQQI